MAEADKRRRAALQERKHRMEEAWQNWTKPVLKPGISYPCPDSLLKLPATVETCHTLPIPFLATDGLQSLTTTLEFLQSTAIGRNKGREEDL